ncbi:MAG: response regulator transcription factor [Gemmatimonadota bacterium]
MRVLVVEDEPKVARFLKQALEEEGHAVDAAGDGVEAGNLAHINDYDLILLDVQLPRMNGLQLASELRRGGVQSPILMLTSRDSTQDVVRGLNAGADDYLTKPFSLDELLARVNALTRRQLGPATGILRYQDLEMDRLKRVVKRGGQPLDISPREFRLLEFFLLNPERVVSRTSLLEKVWDLSFDPETNVVDAHISNLRKKLEDRDRPRLIQTVRGAGYALRIEGAD